MDKRFMVLWELAVDLKQNHGMRWGQAVFNAASHTFPMATETARGDSLLDPFYNDDNVGRFVTHLLEVNE